jgi:hypothetical protein
MRPPFESCRTRSRFLLVWFALSAFHAFPIFVGFASQARIAFGQEPDKVWSVDLAKDTDFRKRLSALEVSLDAPAINFLSNSQLICDFYDGEKGGYNLSMPPSGYHVLEIDAQNGAFGRKLDFQPVDDHSRALPTDDGGFVVFTGKELKKFNNEFVSGVSYPTPREQVGDVLGRALVDVAPSLQTILVYHDQPRDTQGRWAWLRAKDLTIADSIQGPLSMMIQASDTRAIFEGGINEAQLLSVSGELAVICARCDAHFLTNDLLFVDKVKSYNIQTVRGKQQGMGRLNTQASNFSRAAHATRIAYVTGGYVGWGFPIEAHFNKIVATIVVRDWTTNDVIAEIHWAERVGNPSAGLTQMALALSPDGKYLAVLLHHTLSLYRLP